MRTPYWSVRISVNRMLHTKALLVSENAYKKNASYISLIGK